jgi:hypothetical protein
MLKNNMEIVLKLMTVSRKRNGSYLSFINIFEDGSFDCCEFY